MKILSDHRHDGNDEVKRLYVRFENKEKEANSMKFSSSNLGILSIIWKALIAVIF